MIVEIRCEKCTDDYTKNYKMEPVGYLTISQDNTQCQEYKCPFCGILVQILINTSKNEQPS